MGFHDVYEILQVSFPTYDPQLLEAIAKNHRNDLYGAFCAMIEIPRHLRPKSAPNNHLSVISSRASSEDDELFYESDIGDPEGDINANVSSDDEKSLSSSNDDENVSSIRKIEIVDKLIADTTNDKETLFAAMESVIGLMSEVELKEKEAEQAKEEDASADILNKGKELKDILELARDARDMQATEVHAETAVLATELRELQFRMFSLVDQKDKSLAILDEMRQALHERLAVAEDEIRHAEKRRLERKKADLELLVEQELEVVELFDELKYLKRHAADNAKFRGILEVRGRAVDYLQGQLEVLCEDVKMLKENLDKRIPLRESIDIPQGSSNSPASPTWSHKNPTNKLEPVLADASERSISAASSTCFSKNHILDGFEIDLAYVSEARESTDSGSDAIFDDEEEAAAEDDQYVFVKDQEDWEFQLNNGFI